MQYNDSHNSLFIYVAIINAMMQWCADILVWVWHVHFTIKNTYYILKLLHGIRWYFVTALGTPMATSDSEEIIRLKIVNDDINATETTINFLNYSLKEE